MKKLTLDLDALAVESFAAGSFATLTDTAARGFDTLAAEARGTVVALTATAEGETCLDAECSAEGDTALFTCGTCQSDCTCITCGLTCGEGGEDEPRRIILY